MYVWLIHFATHMKLNNIVKQLYSKKKINLKERELIKPDGNVTSVLVQLGVGSYKESVQYLHSASFPTHGVITPETRMWKSWVPKTSIYGADVPSRANSKMLKRHSIWQQVWKT